MPVVWWFPTVFTQFVSISFFVKYRYVSVNRRGDENVLTRWKGLVLPSSDHGNTIVCTSVAPLNVKIPLNVKTPLKCEKQSTLNVKIPLNVKNLR